MSYVLGLDVGAASIGWACVNDSQSRIIASGARVFPEGVARDKQGGEKSKNAERRENRQARRQLERRRRRRSKVRFILQTHGLWPTGNLEQTQLDPYALRDTAARSPLPLHQLGQALYHLAKRRGFKSSRKTGNPSENSVVYQGIAAIASQMSEGETLGSLFNRLRTKSAAQSPHGIPDRIRGVYTLRAMFEAEFDAIWTTQTAAHPAVLTPALRDELRLAIFYQRPLKPSDDLVGPCELEPGKRRCPSAHRAAQRFRLLQEVNNLRTIDARGTEHALTDEQRAACIALLDRSEKATFEQLRTKANLDPSSRFNLETGKRESLWGNRTDATLRMKSHFGKAWDDHPTAFKNNVVETLLKEDDEVKLVSIAVTKWAVSPDAAKALSALTLQRGYMGFSLEAITKLTPHMEKGFQIRSSDGSQSAMALAGYLGRDQRPVRKLDSLDAPPGDILNPIVRAALHQLRRVINAVIKRHGKPSSIHVELAREAKGSLAQRKERTFEMATRRKAREKVAAKLQSEFNIQNPTRNDIQRYMLWEDFGHTCPYTGTVIPAAAIFSPHFQVDHILPRYRSLDNSYANKVLCTTDANKDKGDRTPFEWLGHDQARFEAMLLRVRRLWAVDQGPKAKRFSRQSCELDDFVARQLADTAYISSQLAQYLARLGIDVVIVRGQSTADLRWRWGIDSVLRNDGLELKNREDHRHHAVDAIVIALTDRKRLLALSSNLKNHHSAESRLSSREAPAIVNTDTGELIKHAAPWPTFRDDVQRVIAAVNVSHRPSRRVSGGLHDDTIYAPTSDPQQFVYRKQLTGLTVAGVSEIRDAAVKKLVLARLAEFAIDPETATKIPPEVWKQPLRHASGVQIKGVRLLKRDETIKPLDAAKRRFVKTGGNHHVAIFELPPDKKGVCKRVAVWTSLLEAARRLKASQPVVATGYLDYPTARLVMVLSPGDMVLAKFGGAERAFVFRTGASTTGQLQFVEANDARPDKVVKRYSARINSTATHGVKAISVTLLGELQWRFTSAPKTSANQLDSRVLKIAQRCVDEAWSNTKAHRDLATQGLATLGGQLTAAIKLVRAVRSGQQGT